MSLITLPTTYLLLGSLGEDFSVVTALYFLVKEQGMPVNVPDSQGNTALHLAASILPDKSDIDRDGYEYPGVDYDLCILSPYLASIMKTERIVPKSMVNEFLVNLLQDGGYEWADGKIDTQFILKEGCAGPSDFSVLFTNPSGHEWWDLKTDNFVKILHPQMVGILCPTGNRKPPLPVHIVEMLIELGADVTAVNKNGQTALDIAVAGGESCEMSSKALEEALSR